MTEAISIHFAPAFDWPFLMVMAVGIVLVSAIGIWRAARGVWWRLLVGLLVILALANPSLIEEQRAPLDDIAIVVVDESASQRIGDREAQTDAALAEVMAQLEQFETLNVRVVNVEGGAAGAADQGTLMFEALERALTDVPRDRLAGIIALSDGQIHDAPAAEGLAPQSDAADEDPEAGDNPLVGTGGLPFAAPFHTLLTGSPDDRDRRLQIVEAPSFGLVGRDQIATIVVEDTAGNGSIADVTVRQNGEVTATLPVIIGEETEITLPIEHAGSNVFEFEVAPGEDELTIVNNRAVVDVNGVRDRLRVLLVSGEPHAGERSWRDLLKSDPSVDLIHFTILRPPEKNDNTPVTELSLISFPVRELFEIQIDEFDLIIFDRYRRRGVLPPVYLDNIARYVENGGAFLEAVGPTFATPLSLFYTPLGDVLPGTPNGEVYEEGFLPEITEIGLRHPVTDPLTSFIGEDGLPTWGRWFRQIGNRPTSGATVMTGVAGEPLLILDRVGEGRVAQLMSDQIWLWARGFEGGGPQQELLRRVAHWLMREPALEEDVLRADVEGDQIVVERRTLEDTDAPVEVTFPDGETVTIELGPADEHGVARGALAVGDAGLYRLDDGTRVALAAVGGLNPVEYADVRATPALLSPVAAATGGGISWLSEDGVPDIRMVRPDRPASGTDWIGLRANGDYVVTGVRDIPLLPPLAVLILVLGALLVAWRREGR